MPHPSHARGRGRLRGACEAGRGGLNRATLEQVLLAPDAALEIGVHGSTESAVLVPLFYDAGGELHAVFTKRREDLRRHAGEISFPGGRRDDEDASLMETALREAEEEIGLSRAHVDVVGALPPTPTFVTDYAIYPYVGLIESGHVWEIEPREVDRVLELRIADIRAGYARRRLVRRGIPFRTDTYVVGDDLIWGATGRIVADLLERLPP